MLPTDLCEGHIIEFGPRAVDHTDATLCYDVVVRRRHCLLAFGPEKEGWVSANLVATSALHALQPTTYVRITPAHFCVTRKSLRIPNRAILRPVHRLTSHWPKSWNATPSVRACGRP